MNPDAALYFHIKIYLCWLHWIALSNDWLFFFIIFFVFCFVFFPRML